MPSRRPRRRFNGVSERNAVDDHVVVGRGARSILPRWYSTRGAAVRVNFLVAASAPGLAARLISGDRMTPARRSPLTR